VLVTSRSTTLGALRSFVIGFHPSASHDDCVDGHAVDDDEALFRNSAVSPHAGEAVVRLDEFDSFLVGDRILLHQTLGRTL
jgi:hypothetical protein